MVMYNDTSYTFNVYFILKILISLFLLATHDFN